jgi:hypothetical protein
MAEEAAKLFGAVEGWLHSARGGPAPDTEQAEPAEHSALGPECRVCPFCQLVHVVRGSRPELLEHLAEAATHLALALRVGIEQSEHRWAARRPDAGVEHIDIG